MSTGLCFLRKVLENKGPGAFLDTYRLRREDFTESELQVVDFIESHLGQYSKLPAIKTVQRSLEIAFPDLPDEPVEFWAEEVRKRAVAGTIRSSLTSAIAELKDGNSDEAATVIQNLAVKLIDYSGDTKVRTFFEVAQEVVALHDRRQLKPSEFKIIPYGLPTLDEITDGAQKGDNVVIAGKTSIGKTVLLCHCINAAYTAGWKILVITLEMSRQQIGRRILAWRAGVNERAIRLGQLSTFSGRKYVSQVIAELETGPPLYILDAAMLFDVEDILVYARALGVDAIYLDGADLTQTRNRRRAGKWEDIANAVETVKRLAIQADVPIIGTYQLNDDDSVYGGKRIEHMASQVIKLRMPRKIIRKRGEPWDEDLPDEREAVITKGRFGEKGIIRLGFYPAKSCIEEIGTEGPIRGQGGTEDR